MSDTTHHLFVFRVSGEGVEHISAQRYRSIQRYPDFLLYKHPNTEKDPVPVNVWAGEKIGGITTNLRAGRRAQIKESLFYDKQDRRFRISTGTMIGIRTIYCDRLMIRQPDGSICCERQDEEWWTCTVKFRIGKKCPLLFQKISHLLLPTSQTQQEA